MKLSELTGIHNLYGVEITWDPVNQYNYMLINLDGITYKITEDPDDGYRSTMGEIEQVATVPRTTFPPQKMRCYLSEDENILYLNDFYTNENVIKVGTDWSDIWYPNCVFHYCPENMKVNKQPLYF